MKRPGFRKQVLADRVSRRQVLTAAAGAALGLPWLPSLKAHATPSVAPKRLLLMYTPNGVIPDAWWPLNVTSETAFDLAECHQGLLPFRDRLIFLSGVDLTIAANGGPGGLHQRGIGGLYTGQQLQEGTEFVDGCGQRAGWANGISVDQEVARQIGQGTLLGSLELGVHALDNDVQGRISYAGPGQPLPPMNSPQEVFDRLFYTDDAALRQQRATVLDAVKSQFDALAPRLSAEDRARLDAHLTVVRDVERRLTEVAVDTCAAPTRPEAIDPTDPNSMPATAELSLDLLAVAFGCDLTRVASFEVSTSLNRLQYPWLGSMGEGHSLSHSGPSNSQARTELVARDTWHSQQLQRFLTKLSETPDVDGTTVLDNTLVVWCTEVSLGSTHSHLNMPFLMVGGGWHFRTGRSLTYQSVSHGNLLVSILNAMGVEATTFGNPEFCSGPLTGLV